MATESTDSKFGVFPYELEKSTLSNNRYRIVVNTNPQQQLVLMSLPKNTEIGDEKHKKSSQFIRNYIQFIVLPFMKMVSLKPPSQMNEMGSLESQ
jgi:hypothetical protein